MYNMPPCRIIQTTVISGSSVVKIDNSKLIRFNACYDLGMFIVFLKKVLVPRPGHAKPRVERHKRRTQNNTQQKCCVQGDGSIQQRENASPDSDTWSDTKQLQDGGASVTPAAGGTDGRHLLEEKKYGQPAE